MFQRIQTLYLILTTILSGIFLNCHIIKFPDGQKNILSIGSGGLSLTNSTGGKETLYILLLITIVVLGIFLISLTTVFLYRKRRTQMKLAAVCIVLSCILILASAYYYANVAMNYEGSFRPGFNILVGPLILILSWLSYRGIRKDEELVKSYDRLR
ncbi:MAG: DUF4293 domain-containing protein [Bacteroidales bacterium]|nr:DUF4293 domain-containing protein [Bacteroidales bacterium]